MKRLAIIPTAFAFVAMVAACTDMTAPEVTPPQFDGGPAAGQCPPGSTLIHFQGAPTPAALEADRNGDRRVCERPIGGGSSIFTDNRVPIRVGAF